MKKKLLAMLLCVAMLLTLVPTMAFAAEPKAQKFKKVTGDGFVNGGEYLITTDITEKVATATDTTATKWTFVAGTDDNEGKFAIKSDDGYLQAIPATGTSWNNYKTNADENNATYFNLERDTTSGNWLCYISAALVGGATRYYYLTASDVSKTTSATKPGKNLVFYADGDSIDKFTGAMFAAGDYYVVGTGAITNYQLTALKVDSSGHTCEGGVLKFADGETKTYAMTGNFTGVEVTPVGDVITGADGAAVWTATEGDADGYFKLKSGNTNLAINSTRASLSSSANDYRNWMMSGNALVGRYATDGRYADNWRCVNFDGTTFASTGNVTNSENLPADGAAEITLYKLLRAEVTSAPQFVGATLNYNGSAQTLVNGEGVADGTMQYVVTQENYRTAVELKEAVANEDVAWQSVCSAKAPGVYYVWYYAEGTGDYVDSEVAKVSGTITINPRVTYHPNGGTFSVVGKEEYSSASAINRYPTYDTPAYEITATGAADKDIITKGNKVFAGWYTDSDCTESYNFTQKVTGNLDLYAKWVDNAYTVNVTVGKETGWNTNFFDSVNVELWRGDYKVTEGNRTLALAERLTGFAAPVTITLNEQVPAGDYTLVVKYAYDGVLGFGAVNATSTKSVTIGGDENPFPLGVVLSYNMTYTVDTDEAGRDVTVEGLENAFIDGNAPERSVAVTVEKVNVEGDEEALEGTPAKAVFEIEAADHSANKEYLNITVYKDGTDTEDIQTKTDNLLTFAVEFPTANRQNFVVYHDYADYATDPSAEADWKVDTLTTTPDEITGECIIVDTTNNTITIKAKFFSVYAIGYDDIVTYSGGGGGVSTYTITTGEGVIADKKSASSGTTVTLTVADGYEAPVVKDKNGKTVAVTEGKDGKFTFKMPASAVTVSVEAAEVADTVCEDFLDVNVEAWYHEGVHYCLDNGMMKGIAADTFAPAGNTTRAMIVTMLARLSGYSVNGAGSKWYVPSMEWAVANGVSDGTNMTGNITREQLAAMLYRYAVEIAKVDVDKFTADTNTLSYDDVFTVSSWANAGVHFCLASGIITGYEDGTIRPQANATRAEVAKMFMSFCENVLGK